MRDAEISAASGCTRKRCNVRFNSRAPNSSPAPSLSRNFPGAASQFQPECLYAETPRRWTLDDGNIVAATATA